MTSTFEKQVLQAQGELEQHTDTIIEYKSELLLGGLPAESDKWADVLSPFDGSKVGSVQIPNPDQIEIALQRATEGFEITSALAPSQRARILQKASEIIIENGEELAKLICLEVGKPIKQARVEVRKTADVLKLSAEEALRIGGEVIPLSRQEINSKRLATLTYQPLGPVLAISAFNFPLLVTAHKVAPAIAAGNSVILKPSPHAAITAYNLAKILLQAGLPEEALCLLNCSNQQTERLAQDYRVKAINFTGSSPVGWNLRANAHPGTKVLLELGGNAPVIVHHDADLEKAIPACLRGAFAYSGQSCISVQRIYLQDRILPDFIEQFVEATRNLVIGNPLDNETDLGPLINEASVKRIHLWVEEAVSEGAKLLFGGQALTNNCYAPTILRDVKSKMNIVSSEAFGPIVCLLSYDSIDEVIQEANDTAYGLSAGVFTQDIDLAFSLSKKINAGTIMINDSSAFRADEMPVGAYGQSGLGLESPRYAIRELSNTKVTCVNLD